jgi:polyhydroxybutyrate depolymerase
LIVVWVFVTVLGACLAPVAVIGAQTVGAADRPECSQTAAPGDSQISIDSDGQQRTATIHVPPAPAGLRLPLLVALHGASQDAGFFAPYSGFSPVADGEGFIVVYPNAAGHPPFWTINDHNPRAADDVAFVSHLLDYITAHYCVDVQRVYAAGVSNGGGMAGRLGCELSNRFAAIAPIAGGYRSLPPCHPRVPVSVVEVHGTADGAVPYYGDRLDHAGSVPVFLSGWLARDGCRTRPTRHRIGVQVLRLDWAACTTGASVEHIEIVGGAHQLPGAMPPDKGPPSTVSVPWLVWSFLRTHRRLPPGESPPGQAPPGQSPPGSLASVTGRRPV